MDTYVVKRLDQAKLLTDPFKLKLLEQFGGSPVTTKQVADQMGEKAPRLYRHVDALFDAGLLKLVEEKPKRGTVERTASLGIDSVHAHVYNKPIARLLPHWAVPCSTNSKCTGFGRFLRPKCVLIP